MNKLSIAVVALIGTTQTIRLNKDQDTTFVQLPEHTISFAQAASRSGSGVRAKWIELPNCQDLILWDTAPVVFDS